MAARRAHNYKTRRRAVQGWCFECDKTYQWPTSGPRATGIPASFGARTNTAAYLRMTFLRNLLWDLYRAQSENYKFTQFQENGYLIIRADPRFLVSGAKNFDEEELCLSRCSNESYIRYRLAQFERRLNEWRLRQEASAGIEPPRPALPRRGQWGFPR